MIERSVNLESMSKESLEGLAQQAGVKLTAILNKAKAESDSLLLRYGLELNLGYEIKSISSIKAEEQ